MKKLIFSFLFIVLLSGAISGQEASIILATTTSTQQTGLLDILLPAFTKATGIVVKPVAVGTGKALKLAKNGDADVVMVHARKLENKFVSEGYGINPWDLMFNDFVVVGPASDPALVKDSSDIATVMKKIAKCQEKFISRGDRSGTHEKELELWEIAKIRKTGEKYVETGQGMSETLKMASEMQAYVLCDRATWLFLSSKVQLAVLYANPSELKNPYGLIAVSSAKVRGAKTDLANKFIEWATASEAQSIIENFKIQGTPLFHLSVKKRKLSKEFTQP